MFMEIKEALTFEVAVAKKKQSVSDFLIDTNSQARVYTLT